MNPDNYEMKFTDFDMTFRDELLEMVKIGVIALADDGTILKTKYGLRVYDHMQKKKIIKS